MRILSDIKVNRPRRSVPIIYIFQPDIKDDGHYILSGVSEAMGYTCIPGSVIMLINGDVKHVSDKRQLFSYHECSDIMDDNEAETLVKIYLEQKLV